MSFSASSLWLQSNNRLVPFFISFAIVSATFFLPWLGARSQVDDGAPAWLYWIGPAITLAVGCGLFAKLRGR